MTDTHAPETFTPAAKPMTERGERTIIAAWNVGHADEDGWQPQAWLEISHWKKARCYDAVLHVARVKTEDGVPCQKFNASAMANEEEILKRDAASRFNRYTFAAVHEDALAQLRKRFEAGDEAVTSFFDPTSDKYTV